MACLHARLATPDGHEQKWLKIRTDYRIGLRLDSLYNVSLQSKIVYFSGRTWYFSTFQHGTSYNYVPIYAALNSHFLRDILVIGNAEYRSEKSLPVCCRQVENTCNRRTVEGHQTTPSMVRHTRTRPETTSMSQSIGKRWETTGSTITRLKVWRLIGLLPIYRSVDVVAWQIPTVVGYCSRFQANWKLRHDPSGILCPT